MSSRRMWHGPQIFGVIGNLKGKRGFHKGSKKGSKRVTSKYGLRFRASTRFRGLGSIRVLKKGFYKGCSIKGSRTGSRRDTIWF